MFNYTKHSDNILKIQRVIITKKIKMKISNYQNKIKSQVQERFLLNQNYYLSNQRWLQLDQKIYITIYCVSFRKFLLIDDKLCNKKLQQPTKSKLQSRKRMFNNFTAQKQYECCNIIIPSTEERGALLIGDFNSATNQDILKKHSIKTVITSAAGLQHLQIPNFVTHIVYPLKDAKTQNIRAYFDESYITIDRKLNEGGVLVHCAAGVSRSATLVIAYIMKKDQMGFKSAINLVRSKRNGVCPNLGFQIQLKKFETEVNIEPPKKIVRKNVSEVLNENKNTEAYQFTPVQSTIHSKKKPDAKKTGRPFGYSKPRERPMYDVKETELFVSGKAQRPSSQVRDTNDKYNTTRKNPMMGTWGPIKHKTKKYEL